MSATTPHRETTPDASAWILKSALTSPPRLRALQATGLMDSSGNPVLDRIARLASRLLNVPVGLVSLVSDTEQHFPGMHGLSGWPAEQRGTGLSYSFCQYVVSGNAPLVIQDTARHLVMRHSPARIELGVVAYAGVPLRTGTGEVLGALCVINTQAVEWTTDQIDTLEDLAAAAMAEIELRATTKELMATHQLLVEQATRDALTGLLNRRGFTEHARRVLAEAQESETPLLVCALDLNDFKYINDTFGHGAGDEALMEMAALLSSTFRDCDVVARTGGDEFVVIVTNATMSDIPFVSLRFAATLDVHNDAPGQEFMLSSSLGFAAFDPAEPISLAALMREADRSMYEHKRQQKNADLFPAGPLPSDKPSTGLTLTGHRA